MIGCVFSPYYAWSGRGDPLNHVTLNAVLYQPRGSRWAMTERGRQALGRTADSLTIGPSSLEWDGETLTVRIDEVTAPIPSRLRGMVRLRPQAVNRRIFWLDPAGRQRWRPIGPHARIEVTLEQPDLRWSGSGYFDMNVGEAPLEQDFVRWDWSRADLGDGTAILYDVTRRDGQDYGLALCFAPDGSVSTFEPPPPAPLPPNLWRVARGTRADPGHPARVIKTLEDAPFYARSVVATHLLGQPVTAMHESLDLDRFSKQWVRLLLPFRMPRAVG